MSHYRLSGKNGQSIYFLKEKMKKTTYTLLSILIATILTFTTGVHIAQAASGSEYYVSASNGSDTNPGSQESPWRSIQKAANAMPAGSTAIVLAGNYQERVTIKRPELVFQAQGEVSMQGFSIQADDITISGFTITSLTDNITTGIGIDVPKAGYCVIENNRLLYNTWGGLRLAGSESDPDASHDCIVQNNVFFRNGLFAAEVMGQDHLIENNDVSHTIQHHPCSSSTADWLDADAFRFHGSGHVFKNNYIHDMEIGPAGFDQTSCSIANLANLNKDYVSDSHTDCFQTYDGSRIAGHDILFEGNRCEMPAAGEWTGGASAKAFQGTGDIYNLTFQNNLVVADMLSFFEDGCHDMSIVHNTFIGTDPTWSQGLKFINCDGSIVVKNNVFYRQENGEGHIHDSNGSVNAGNNCVYRASGRPSRPADPWDIWNVNPQLSSEYHLEANSPCIDEGANLGLSNDLEGNPRPQGGGYDIGAFEFLSSGNTYQLSLISQGAQDGWVQESEENSNKGGVKVADGVFINIGDNAQNKQFRGILSFDTVGIPDTAEITKATLKIKIHSAIGDNPFAVLGNVVVDIRRGAFYGNPILQQIDFQAFPNQNFAGLITSPPSDGWYVGEIKESSLGFINKIGTTQFRLRFYKDDDNDLSDDYARFFSGDHADPVYRPVLEVEYMFP